MMDTVIQDVETHQMLDLYGIPRIRKLEECASIWMVLGKYARHIIL
jgi:hypothetical protein